MAESKSASVVFTNGSLLAKNARASADSAKSAADNAYNLANGAQRTADGKNSVYRGSDPSTVPTAGLKEGDIYFTATALYTWNGSAWEKTVSDTTGAEIHAKVEAAMQESQKSVADLKSDVEAKVKKLDDEIAQNKIKTGNALNFYKEQYYLSTSYTELTGGSWSDEVPEKVKGKYVWSRYVTANIGDSTNYQYSNPVCISGLDGEQGPQGPKGDTGATGLQGLQGPKGDQGIQGPQGVSSYTHIAYANSADGQSGFDVSNGSGKTYIGVYVDSNSTDSADPAKYTWTLIKGERGDQGIPGTKGADGQTPYFHIAYADSSDGSIGFDTTNSSGKLYIGQYTDYTQADSTNPASYAWTKIKGETGQTGATGPQGPKGDTGDQGIPGPKGADGQTTYVHFAYANSADGNTNFNTSYFSNALYVGTYTDYTPTDSGDYTKYTWSRLKGDTGNTGATGPQGVDGTDAPTITVKSYTFSAANGAIADIELTGPNAFKQTVYSRGHNVWVFDATTHKLKEFVNCDTYTTMSFNHNGANTTLADYLAGLTDSIVVIAAADADSIDQNVRNVLNSMGGSPELGTWPSWRVGHVFIGMSKRSDDTWPLQPLQGYEEAIIKDGSAPEIGCTLSNGGIVANGAPGATGATGPKGDTGDTGFFIGTTPPPNPTKGTVWATNDSSGNMTSAKTWNGSNWVSTAFTQDLVAGNITADKIVGGTLDVNKITIANAQNIPVTSTVSLGDKLSNIEQDADGLTLIVKNKGQNLLRDTDTVPMWSGDKETVDNFTVVKAVMTWDGDWYDPIAWNNLTTIKPNTDYTLSFWAKADQPADIYSYLYNIGTDTVYMDGSTLSHLTTSYQRFEIHFHTQNFSAGRTVNCLPMRVITKNITHYIYGCQLEEGTMATAWSPAPEDISALKVTSDSLNAYVKGSKGSDTLKAILSMDPNSSSIAQVVNGQIAAAIGTYSDGSVRIDGKALYINSHAKIDDATIKSAMIDSIEAEKIKTGTLNADKVNIINLNADKIASGTLNGMTITGSTFIATGNNITVEDNDFNTCETKVDESGLEVMAINQFDSKMYASGWNLQAGSSSLGERTIEASVYGSNPYIKLTSRQDSTNATATTNIDSRGISTGNAWLGGTVQAPTGWFGNWKIQDNRVYAQRGTIYVANRAGGNFDSNGSAGFQVWAGIGLGKDTIYTPSNNLYIQQGQGNPALSQPYSSAGKVDVHCNSVISQRANTVSSRLSVKTDITPVSYDRALAAVEGTEMYDYRYTSDDSGQHYVSGIIDDVNPDPQYHMDDMLINKERTARIDANLVGYHHVIIQKLLDRVAALEEKVK